jgi:hypothetical protein
MLGLASSSILLRRQLYSEISVKMLELGSVTPVLSAGSADCLQLSYYPPVDLTYFKSIGALTDSS